MHPSIIIFYVLLFPVNFVVCAQVFHHEAVAQGLRFQVQADSMQRLIEAQILTLSTASEAEKNGIKNAIRDYEALTVALQKKANEWFDQATTFELPTDTVDIVSISVYQDSIAMIDEMLIPQNFETKNNEKYAFSILPKSPYSTKNPVPVDVSLPNGVVYKIQLGAFRNPSAAKTFKGLTPLSGETLENGVIKYYAGLFRQFADADDALRKVHEYGFKDAFIVAFYNQKTIHIGRARQLEAGY